MGSFLGNILIGFSNTIKAMSYNFTVELRDPPKSMQDNCVYISPGRDITFTERGGNRVTSCQIYLTVLVRASDRADAAATLLLAEVQEAILDAIDTNRTLQQLVESCLPVDCPFYYTDSDQSQGVALRLTYNISYIRPRNRPSR